jgi:hypothetical protein
MKYVILCIPIIVICILSCGCVQNGGEEFDAELYNQSVQAVKVFVENESYEPETPLFSIESGIATLSGEYETYSIDLSTGEIVFASYQGQEGIERAREGPHYEKTLIAVRQFLQNPEFEMNATGFTFEDDRYEISGTGMTFRVNASSGEITRALITGPEAVLAMANSTVYQQAANASGINQTE